MRNGGGIHMLKDYAENYKSFVSSAPLPDDFAAYWRDRTQAKTAILRSMEFNPIEIYNPFSVYERLKISFISGLSIYAVCVRPSVKDGKFPTVIMYHDLYRGIRGLHHLTRFPACGYAVIALDAVDYGSDPEKHPPLWALRNRISDALTLAAIAETLDFVDEKHVFTWGEGFGGALALDAAAIVPGIEKCALINPFPAIACEKTASDPISAREDGICRRSSNTDNSLYSGIDADDSLYGGINADDRKLYLPYIDTANFARFVSSGVLMGVCLMDTVAKPENQLAIYNSLPADLPSKQLKLYPKYAHERVNAFENEVLKFFISA